MEVLYRGTTTRIHDGIIYRSGLEHPFIGEVILFHPRSSLPPVLGFVFDPDGGATKAAVSRGSDTILRVGDYVTRTGSGPETRAGLGILGQIITPLGECLNTDDLDPFEYFMDTNYYSEFVELTQGAPGVTHRLPVRLPFYTGCAAVDRFLPIGRGQRELILGDNKTGKTALALTAIINQRQFNFGVWFEAMRLMNWYAARPRIPAFPFTPCVYVAIGQKRAEIVRIRRALVQFPAHTYTCIVFTSADQLASMQYIAPYAGCAIGEWFRDRGYHALIVYDDSTQHAVAYRQMSLLLRRPPAREAYPADIFSPHSRLSERAAQSSHEHGGGSLTALPIVETQLGDIPAYVPTNVISITDGQLFLSRKIANLGRRPAIDFGLSASRVGAASQVPAMAAVPKSAKLTHATYRRLAGIERLGGDIPRVLQIRIDRGKRLSKFMSQAQYHTLSLYEQIVGMYLFASPIFDGVDHKYTSICAKSFISPRYAELYLSGRAQAIVANHKLFNHMLSSLPSDIIKEEVEIIGRSISETMRITQPISRRNTFLEGLMLSAAA
jgi:F-type H+-transporting ATPase subunit alpha